MPPREREPHLPLAEVDGIRGRRQVLDPQVALAIVLLPEVELVPLGDFAASIGRIAVKIFDFADVYP